MKPSRHKRPRPPLDAEGLERLALFYVGRYATTRAKLRDYLARKLRERGWGGSGSPDLDALVGRCVAMGAVDDAAFAAARAASLTRRGYGRRRVDLALKVAGIEEEDAAHARAEADEQALAAALHYARRRRLGPWAAEAPADRAAWQKAAAAMLRAGHPIDVVRRVLNASPGDIPDSDAC